MVTPEQKEQCAVYVEQTFKVSHARACKLVSCSRTTKYYNKKMPIKDARLVELISQVIGSSQRGRKKVIPLVLKKDPKQSAFRIRRVYTQSGYSLFKRPRKRIANNQPNPAQVPLMANEEWAIDFMYDSLVTGRAIRSLNIIDPFNRVCKGIYIKHSFAAKSLIESLEQAIEKHGKPKFIRTDNGPEFISKAFQLWMHKNGIKWYAIEKGKPQQNCFIERFNRTAREEFFDLNLFRDLQQANELAGVYLNEYNDYRPHESLLNQTPSQYAA